MLLSGIYWAIKQEWNFTSPCFVEFPYIRSNTDFF